MSARPEYTYESQNDQQLDDLASKLRSIKNVTTDLNTDAESQNFQLDDTRDTFSSFTSSLAQTGRSTAQAFGNSPGGASQCRLISYVVGSIVTFWFIWRVAGAWMGS